MAKSPADFRDYFAQRRHVFLQRRRIVYELMGNKCEKCGNPPHSLYYRDVEKQKATKRSVLSLLEKADIMPFLREIDSCILLCRKCAAAHKREHGTNAMWLAGCRCDACRSAHKTYEKKTYLRKKRQKYSEASVHQVTHSRTVASALSNRARG